MKSMKNNNNNMNLVIYIYIYKPHDRFRWECRKRISSSKFIKSSWCHRYSCHDGCELSNLINSSSSIPKKDTNSIKPLQKTKTWHLSLATVRSTTLGVSVGTKHAIEPVLGTFNLEALDHLGLVVYIAKLWDSKLFILDFDWMNFYCFFFDSHILQCGLDCYFCFFGEGMGLGWWSLWRMNMTIVSWFYTFFKIHSSSKKEKKNKKTITWKWIEMRTWWFFYFFFILLYSFLWWSMLSRSWRLSNVFKMERDFRFKFKWILWSDFNRL